MPKETKVIIHIKGMHCASCVMRVENALKKINGVIKVEVNFALEHALVIYDSDQVGIKEIFKVIKDSGYQPVEEDYKDLFEELSRSTEHKQLKHRFLLALLFTIPVFYLSMGESFHIFIPSFLKNNSVVLQFIFSTVVLMCGLVFFKTGIIPLFKKQPANMNTLVSVGVSAAYLNSVFIAINYFVSQSLHLPHLYFETVAVLLTFILLGRYLEARTRAKTSQAIEKLIGLRPKEVTVFKDNKEELVNVNDLKVGDIIVMHPGERIPVDGELIDGIASLDESMVTGESIPVEKVVGSKVISGTLNKTGVFKFQATRVGEDSFLAQIIKLVAQAQSSKAPIQRLADKIASIFVPAVFVVALIAFFIWFLFTNNLNLSLNIFISVLIVACPCALGLATPTAVIAGMGISAQRGILVKQAESFQKLDSINLVVFDKTATLTKGVAQVSDVLVVDDWDEKKIIVIAASIEKSSEHPLASAILNYAQKISVQVSIINKFDYIPGRGIKSFIDGQEVFVGNAKFMQDNEINIDKIETIISQLQNKGKTVVFVASKNILKGVIAVSDVLKENSKYVVSQLQRDLKKVCIVTGDNKLTADYFADELKVNDVFAEVSPENKAVEVKRLQQYYKVAMVGDGINDAVALSVADVGIAIGSGTDVAIESADIVLMRNNLDDLIFLFQISRYTLNKIKQNLFWAFFYNILGIGIACGVIYPFTGIILNPMIAALAMIFSSVSVVTNSLSMYKHKFS